MYLKAKYDVPILAIEELVEVFTFSKN